MSGHPWARREFLRATGLALSSQALSPKSLFGGALSGQAPAIVTSDRARPSNAFGVMAGDVDGDRAIVWSRTDRASRLIVEYGTTESFTDAKKVTGPAALEVSDFTARVDLDGLPAGQRIFYRASFQSLADLKVMSEPVTGTFITPERPALLTRSERRPARDITVAWTADTVGQGWGIDTNLGGMRLYDAMRKTEPDLFIHCGDTIYADQPLLSEVKLDDGRVWKNLVTPEKSKPAETLDEYRGNHRYNLLDEHVRRFNASVSQFALWDDHEVLDNWYPTEILAANARHAEKSVALLAARAKRAFLDYTPIRINQEDPERIYRAYRFGPLVEVFGFDMRSYRGANSPNRQPAGPNGAPAEDAAILGAAQVEWLKRRLAASTATWKIIASDMPLGLVVRDGREAFEAVSNGDPGAPLGREVEIANLLAFIRERRVRNVVFITGDVHYCAAHHYDPARASFTGFNPFWEFVAGPAHAGTFGANELDKTFGPEVRFVGVPKDLKPNRSPAEGFQFFGTLKADGKTRALTAKLHNGEGKTIFTVELPPER